MGFSIHTHTNNLFTAARPLSQISRGKKKIKKKKSPISLAGSGPPSPRHYNPLFAFIHCYACVFGNPVSSVVPSLSSADSAPSSPLIICLSVFRRRYPPERNTRRIFQFSEGDDSIGGESGDSLWRRSSGGAALLLCVCLNPRAA